MVVLAVVPVAPTRSTLLRFFTFRVDELVDATRWTVAPLPRSTELLRGLRGLVAVLVGAPVLIPPTTSDCRDAGRLRVEEPRPAPITLCRIASSSACSSGERGPDCVEYSWSAGRSLKCWYMTPAGSSSLLSPPRSRNTRDDERVGARLEPLSGANRDSEPERRCERGGDARMSVRNKFETREKKPPPPPPPP